MRVSIITVCFNSAKTIDDTIRSVLGQTFDDIEYIIIDGGSSDGTQAVIGRYSGKISRVVSEPDRGLYDAMNKGIALATGDFIGLLNADDFYTDEFVVAELVEKLEKEKTDAVFADLVIVDSQSTGRVLRYYNSGRFRPGRLRFGWMPAHPTLLLRKSLYEKLGGYRLDFAIAADFEMMVRLFWVEKIAYSYVAKPIIRMRSGGVSTSGFRATWLLNNEIVRACKLNGLRTNIGLVLLKAPFKLFERVIKNRKSLV